MTANPFDPTFEQLPGSIPVFPLMGVLLLPRGKLPLNIFEPRYLAMVQDALASDRMIGMIQPQATEAPERPPRLYGLGCAGRITSFAETDDGRFLITLTGVCRFALGRSCPPPGATGAWCRTGPPSRPTWRRRWAGWTATGWCRYCASISASRASP
ncbi:LON peptidase substrate-binding domain-containing protein [Aerophototrophica crusticola]|uniref:LON peptidase substrate-binding domain-containing protein n=1 Tax=Aerophototrophica crusticola TaxID=1709002 RepID=UPI00384F2D22